jgi:hypothetical protein
MIRESRSAEGLERQVIVREGYECHIIVREGFERHVIVREGFERQGVLWSRVAFLNGVAQPPVDVFTSGDGLFLVNDNCTYFLWSGGEWFWLGGTDVLHGDSAMSAVAKYLAKH